MVWPSSGCSPFVVLFITWWVVDVVGFIKRPTNVATACWLVVVVIVFILQNDKTSDK